MSRLVRAAMTQTLNVYSEMPTSTDEFQQLGDHLEAVRTANLEHHAELTRAAKRHGASVICFGELFAAPYFALTRDEVWLNLAEELNGPTSSFVRELARELEMVIIAPIYEFEPASGKRFNTALFVDSDGEQLGFYSKTHIPHGRNEMGVFAEGFYFERSTGREQPTSKNLSANPFFPVFETSVGKIGVAICYDRHFEGVISTLRAEGAELIFSPAVTFGAKSARLWPMEFAVDASRWQVFIGGSNRRGREPPYHQDFFGNSHFTGPDGRVPNLSDHSELIISELDLEALAQPDAAGWNLPRDARFDIYDRRGTRAGGKRPWDRD